MPFGDGKLVLSNHSINSNLTASLVALEVLQPDSPCRKQIPMHTAKRLLALQHATLCQVRGSRCYMSVPQ